MRAADWLSVVRDAKTTSLCAPALAHPWLATARPPDSQPGARKRLINHSQGARQTRITTLPNSDALFW